MEEDVVYLYTSEWLIYLPIWGLFRRHMSHLVYENLL
jgi:hypothetical protein